MLGGTTRAVVSTDASQQPQAVEEGWWATLDSDQ
jgi:hypothetical protein